MIRRLVIGALCGGAGWWAGHEHSTLTIGFLGGALVLFIGDVVLEAAT